MRSLVGIAVALCLVGCGSNDDGGSAPSGPSTSSVTPFIDYDGGPVDPYDAGKATPGVCTPQTVQCPSDQHQVCSGDGQWETITDLPACSLSCEAAPGRFLVGVDDNTTTDTTTNLVWMWQSGSGPAPCSDYGSGWRLPTMAELQGIGPGGSCKPNVDSAAFADVNSYYLGVANDFYSTHPSDTSIHIYDANASAFGTVAYGSQAFTRCVK